jgi:hypothetical protein
MHQLLHESFQLLQQGNSSMIVAAYNADYPYDHVILNMGIIQ